MELLCDLSQWDIAQLVAAIDESIYSTSILWAHKQLAIDEQFRCVVFQAHSQLA